MSHPRLAPLAAAAALVTLLCPASASAQSSLRGSRESINRMYFQALEEELSFFETPASVRRQVAAGRLVKLEPDGSFTLYRVGYPFVRPATRTFVERLGAQYRNGCGEALVVTSAVRPATRQPANSADRSVHPTGMAIDLRKPKDRTCLLWLRNALLDLEDAGVLEATEEFAPPHFHVAVFTTPYERYVAAQAKEEARPKVSTRPTTMAATYVVRRGDTLWEIAQMHDTTVEALRNANGLRSERIRPGQELRIPSGE